MVAHTSAYMPRSTPIGTMRDTAFLLALVSYMAVVVIALALMVNHLGA
jgi:hypothetical protein